MKKNVLFLVILAVALTSCRKDSTTTFVYENRSGHGITIKEYGAGKVDDIEILNGSDYIYIYIYYTGQRG